MTARRPDSLSRFPSLGGALAVALCLATGASFAADATADKAPAFAPGWEGHAKPLLWQGSATQTTRQIWRVPSTLEKGNYLVISRVNGVPHLVDGQRFTVTSDPFREINLLIDTSEREPEAIDERFVSWPGQPPAAR